VLATQSFKKRVLVVATIATTIKSFCIPNIRLLQQLGYDVDIAADFSRESWPSGDVDGWRENLAAEGIMSWPIDFTRNATDLPQHVRAYRQLKSLILNERYRFVHTNTPIASAIVRVVCHDTRTRCIYTAHGFHFYKGAPAKNWLLFYPIEKLLSRCTDTLITINDEDYALAKARFHAKETIEIPGAGIDTSKFVRRWENREQLRMSLSIGPQTTVLLSVGELNKNKNHESVIRTLTQIDGDICYCIAGQGPLGNSLSHLIFELGLQDKVRMLGFIDDVTSLYNMADVYIHPSFREGLSTAITEAMACELPVLASNRRGCRDLVDVELGGFLFEPDDVSTIVSAIRRLLASDSKAMGEYNRTKACACSTAVTLATMRKAYSKYQVSY